MVEKAFAPCPFAFNVNGTTTPATSTETDVFVTLNPTGISTKALSVAISSLPGTNFDFIFKLTGLGNAENGHATDSVRLFVVGVIPSLTIAVTSTGPQLLNTCDGSQS